MIVYTKEFEAECKKILQRIDFDDLCVGVYASIKDVCGLMPAGEERDFIEAMMIKKLIDEITKGWLMGCGYAHLNPKLVQCKLAELEL